MCELLVMSSRIAATVDFELGVFARHGGGDGPDKDGWGIAYFESGDVRLIRDAAPAYASPWIGFVEGLSLRSHIVFGHIRRASVGDVALRNTHPFTRELGGCQHVFAHNGSAPGVLHSPDFILGRFVPIGDTDSEWAFCSLLETLASARSQNAGNLSLDARVQIVTDFARRMRKLGTANFLYSDGDVVFVHGHRRFQSPENTNPGPGLHFIIRHDPEKGQPIKGHGGVSVNDTDQPVFLAASVPLTNESWTPLNDGELLVVRDGEILERIGTNL